MYVLNNVEKAFGQLSVGHVKSVGDTLDETHDEWDQEDDRQQVQDQVEP